ncbi:thiol reductant ABC exporter subunit CydC [Hoyosella subflava]|uniref:ABC transporter, CydDC cysteine exporter family, permease/ATP-binding protein CydC n=1 Tax=Hoyosella subflava (strain DSM 45089 / JCM 17490 / NBRC 109087 / DQS3-9A1) TaxID=443218 RepID=F6EL75_HOYSD|nr:thiol reductant ABC exporter subunit CydC [Hoyosella subflava]AEF39167.1 ABC transporter, CydDC cysteine exporter family, permease/ATP-binding protein CydC [Hoyosella subflava DQS3-9A1]
MRTLWRALRLLEIPAGRTCLAIAAATVTLGSALTLAGVSAWLIMRAFEMPPVLDLTVAVVAVRALGISRGVFRYLDRLATHDLALRGTVAARTTVYERLATGHPRAALGASRGGMLARTGEDIDTLGETVVRAVVPAAVAVLLSLAAVVALAVIAPAAALILALALIAAGVLAPLLAAGAARLREAEADRYRGEHRDAAMNVLDHAAELKVSGQFGAAVLRAETSLHNSDRSADRAAVSSAGAASVTPLAVGVSVIGALLIGMNLYATDSLSITSLGILVLLPLAAFEATSALPDAAVHLLRARQAAGRVMMLLDEATSVTAEGQGGRAHGHSIAAQQLHCGWGGTVASGPLTLNWPEGSRVLITGPSGAGKSTLLMTLAGLIPPVGGSAAAGGQPLDDWDPDTLRRTVTFFAEDAHIFATTLRDNLLVARPDATRENMVDAMQRVGLGDWLNELPDGLDTVLVGGDEALSGGQRRRLLLARALLSPASVLLLDEPTEHLDADDAARLLDALLDRDSGLVHHDRTVVVVSHQRPSRTIRASRDLECHDVTGAPDIARTSR